MIHPTKGEIPLELYDYQAQFLADHDRARIVLKARQIGYSLTLGIEAAHIAIMQPRSKILMLSKTKDDAKQLREYAELAIQQDPLAPRIIKNNETLIRLANGSEIRSLAAGPQSGRGFPATKVILDEFAFPIFAEKLYTAISPCISRGGGITVCSTPNGRATLFFLLWEGEQGLTFSRHRIPWWRCPAYLDGWDGTTYTQKDASDPLQPWDGRDPAERGEPRSPWFCAERPKYTKASWAQEFACDFADSGDAVFSTTYVDECAVEAWGLIPYQPGHRYGLAIDPAGKGKDKTCLIVVDITDDVHQIVAYKSWTKGPFELLYSNAAELCAAYHIDTVAIDETGLGAPITEHLRDRVGGAEVIGFTFTSTSKVTLINKFVLRVQRKQFKFKDVPELRRQLLLYQWDDKNLMTDAVMAAALTEETSSATGWMAQIRADLAAHRAAQHAAQETAL